MGGIIYDNGKPVVSQYEINGAKSFGTRGRYDSPNPGNLGVAQRNTFTPIDKRATTPFNDGQLPYSNRPKIEVVADGPFATKSTNVDHYFDRLFISNVQEQDAEKTDVIETFGRPHLFASGRFVRRYTFSGTVRTAPANWNALASGGDPVYAVPQSVLLVRFYDQYLRASIQAKNGWFTRVTVNNEVYEGFVTTLNVNTDGNTEGVASFVFSFLGFQRHHASLEQPADSVLNRMTGPRGDLQQDKFDLTGTSIVATETEQLTSNPLPIIAPSIAEAGHFTPQNILSTGSVEISLTAGTKLLTIAADIAGIVAVFEDGREVDGSILYGGQSVRVRAKVTNYYALYNAVQVRLNSAVPYQSTGLAQVPALHRGVLDSTVTFTVLSGGKRKTFSFSFSISPPDSLKVVSASASIGDNTLAARPLVGGQVRYPATSVSSSLSTPVEFVYVLDYFLTDMVGNLISADTLADANIAYSTATTSPALGGVEATYPSDVQLAASAISFDSPVVVGPGHLRQTVNVDMSHSEIDWANNPFDEANKLLVKLRPVVRIVGYPPISDMPTLVFAIDFGASNLASFFSSLSSVSAEWDPLLRGSSLDRFGTYKLVLSCAGAPSDSVLRALRLGSLHVVTSGPAVLNAIPLSGLRYGTGRITSVDGSKIVLRTRLADTTYRPDLGGLLITIEINTAANTGSIAALYSSRYWTHLASVKSADVLLNPKDGLEAPLSWHQTFAS